MKEYKNIIFGPVHSRRFGVSLGVDLSPNVKQCNFDCVYCELKRAQVVDSYEDIVPLEVLLSAVKHALDSHKNIDVLTITANGEPTLYPHLESFISMLKPSIPPYVKTLILSNGSTFNDKKVQNALQYFDIVKFSLDSIHAKTFKKVDRPSKILNLEHVLQGIESFAKLRKNTLVCEILIVKDFNDLLETIKPLADFLRKIHVDRVDLNTIDRPPAYPVHGVSFDTLEHISALFYDLNVYIPTRKNIAHSKDLLHLDKDEILNLLQKRPISVAEVHSLLDPHSINTLKSLQKDDKIYIKNVGGLDFYGL